MRALILGTVAAALLASGPALAGESGAKPVPAKAERKPAAGKALLKLRVDPPSRVYVDGVDKGKAAEVALDVKPGAHVVRFVHASGDEHENRIVVKAGKTTAYEFKFDYSEPLPTPTAADDVPVP